MKLLAVFVMVSRHTKLLAELSLCDLSSTSSSEQPQRNGGQPGFVPHRPGTVCSSRILGASSFSTSLTILRGEAGCQPGIFIFPCLNRSGAARVFNYRAVVTLPRHCSTLKLWVYPHPALFWLWLNMSGLWLGFGLGIFSKEDWQQVFSTCICNLFKLRMICYI